MVEDPIAPLMRALVESIDAAAARWNETIPEDWESFGLVLGLQDGPYAQGYGYAYGPDAACTKAISAVPDTIESALEAFLADRYP